MSALIRSPSAGVFAALADPVVFARVRLELGAPTWPGEIDIAPDAIHAAIRRSKSRVCRLGDKGAQPA